MLLLGVLGVGLIAALVCASRRRRALYRAVLLMVTAGLTILLGIFGFWPVDDEAKSVAAAGTGCVGSLTHALYLSAQHLFLNTSPSAGDGAWRVASRICALATVLLVAYEALTRLFEDGVRRLLLLGKREHVVVCGLGGIGFSLVRDLLEPGPGRAAAREGRRGVVVVESDRENDRLDAVRDLGAMVVHGDAADEALLRRVSAHKARHVFFTTGSDEVNIEGAYDLLSLLRGERKEPARCDRKPEIHVHLRHGDLGKLLDTAAIPMKESKNEDATETVAVNSFNVLERAADQVVGELLVPWRPGHREVAHFVIVGFGTAGQTLALRLAELAHFENLKRSRMTIVHPLSGEAEAAVARVRAVYPAMMPPPGIAGDPWKPDPALDDWAYGVRIAEVSKAGAPGDVGITFAVNGGFVGMHGAPRSPDFVKQIVELARTAGVRPVVFVCEETDEENCTLSHELRTELDARLKDKHGAYLPGITPVPVFAYVPRRPAMTRASSPSPEACGAPASKERDLFHFGISAKSCSFKALTSRLQRDLAEAIAQGFDRAYAKREGTTPPAPRRLSQMPAWERRSNLSAAAHVSVKLAVLGLRVVERREGVESVAATEPSEELRQIVAKMEHNRWVAERLLSGWSFGPRDNTRKQRTQIADWPNLPDTEMVKDANQVGDILGFCANPSSGFALERADAAKRCGA